MNRNIFTHRTLLSGAVLVLLFALLSAFPVNLNRRNSFTTGSVALAQTSRSYEEFIDGAYQGALGRQPTCEEAQAAYDALASAAAANDLLGGARRFVATLFETANSYDNGNVYLQTTAYQARNPQDSTDSTHQEAFVTDLYHAFLLRNPDSEGFAFWVSCLPSGRKSVLNAFIVCQEFSDLVNTLSPGTRPDCGGGGCGITCPYGYTLDEACQCIPPCEGANNGHYNPLCLESRPLVRKGN